MSTVMPLIFPETQKQVRVVLIEGDPWWVASDVCRVLEIVHPASAMRLLDDDEKGVHSMHTPGGDQQFSIVNESGLYSLILRSRKAEAKAFKRWVTREVIPSIRRTGTYSNVRPAFKVPETFVQALEVALFQAKELEESEKALKVANELQAISDTKIADLTPMAEAAEEYFASDRMLLVREAAKLLGMKEKNLRILLMEKGHLFRRTNAYRDEYYDASSKSVERGWLVPKEYRWKDSKGRAHITYTVYVTPEGVEMVRRVLRGMADRGNDPAVKHSRVTYAHQPRLIDVSA